MPKHPGGRPTEYSKKTLTLAEKYIASCKDGLTKLKVEENELNGAVKFKYVPHVKIPTIEGLALALGINRDTVYDWKNKYPEFSDIISKLQHEQANRLIVGGLSGQYNPIISKVLLTKHGYREGTEISGEEGGKIKLDAGMDEILKKVYGGDTATGDTGQAGGDTPRPA